MSADLSRLTLLRWLLVIAVGYLLLVTPGVAAIWTWSLLAFLGLTSVAFMLAKEDAFRYRAVLPLLLISDAGCLTTALFLSGASGGDFFVVYFLLFAVVALGRGNLGRSAVGSALVVSGYAAVLYWVNEGSLLRDHALLARLPFLMITGTFYGGLAAIANQRGEESQVHRRLLSWVGKLTAAFSDEFEARGVIRQVLLEIDHILQAAVRASIVQLDGETLTALVSSDDPELIDRPLNLERYPEIRQVVEQQLPMVIDDMRSAPILSSQADHTQKLPFRSLLLCPVDLQKHSMGHLILRVAKGTKGFSTQEIDVCQQLAEAIALVFRQAQLQASVDRSERLQMMTQIAATVSHDFNSIFASILVAADHLRKEILERQHTGGVGVELGLAEALEKHFEAIDLATKEGLTMVERLSSWTRVLHQSDQDSHAAEKKAADPVESMKSAWGYSEPFWLKRKATRDLKLEMNLCASPAIAIDPIELREALLNLMLNGIDAMTKGGTLSLAIEHRDAEVVFSVRDTGVGIPDELHEKIFQPMFTTKGSGGTGLGLTVVRSLAQRHDGKIEIESTEGIGTCLRLILPTSDHSDGAASFPATSSSSPAHEQTERDMTDAVLLVEDNELVRDVMVRSLEAAGYVVDTVGSADEAEVLIDAGRPYGCLVVDASPPGEDAISLFWSLHTLKPNLARRILLYSTGEPQPEIRELQAKFEVSLIDRTVGLAAMAEAIGGIVARSTEDSTLDVDDDESSGFDAHAAAS